MLLFDFSNIDFVSRSFAHQYESNKRHVRKTVKEIHISEQVRRMFNAVIERPQLNHETDFHFKLISLSAKNLYE